MQQDWAQIQSELELHPAKIDAEVLAMRSSYPSVWKQNATTAAFFQLFLYPTMMLWRAGGMMLIGMGLMKLGVFSAARSRRVYLTMMLAGYGIGLPIIAAGAHAQIAHRFDMVHALAAGWHFNYVGSVLVALAHVSVIMLVVQHGTLPALTARLAAVGRMALTNYLAQSLICTAIFFGWGAGLFGHVERKWLPLFVAGVWLLQLAYSPWWLARFRFGTAEWLWRSLTYWSRQPMRLGPAS
jgi:uncharacterized protein